MSNEHLCNGGPEDAKQCGCGLTRAELKEAGVGILDDCPKCTHPLAFHPAGPQGEGRSSNSCHLIQHRCCDLKLSLAHLIPHLLSSIICSRYWTVLPSHSFQSRLLWIRSYIMYIYVSSHFSIALDNLKSLYISHLISLISPSRPRLSVL